MEGEFERRAWMPLLSGPASPSARSITTSVARTISLRHTFDARDEPTLARYEIWLDATRGTLADEMAGFFNRLTRVADDKNWKGCGFLRAAAELAGSPGHPALRIGSSHKKKFTRRRRTARSPAHGAIGWRRCADAHSSRSVIRKGCRPASDSTSYQVGRVMAIGPSPSFDRRSMTAPTERLRSPNERSRQ